MSDFLDKLEDSSPRKRRDESAGTDFARRKTRQSAKRLTNKPETQGTQAGQYLRLSGTVEPGVKRRVDELAAEYGVSSSAMLRWLLDLALHMHDDKGHRPEGTVKEVRQIAEDRRWRG